MKLLDITFKNFRNFEEYRVSLGRKVTVFIGRNGMGKTTILDGVVQAISFIFSKQRDTQQYEFIRSTDQGVKSFRVTDPRYGNGDYCYPLSIDICGEISSDDETTPLSWSFEQESKKSGLKDSKFRTAYHDFWRHYNTNEEKPVFAFFSDGFPHRDTNISSTMKEKLKSGNPLPASDGYYQWDKEQSCVNIWKRYFVQQWMNNRLNPDAEKAAYVAAINAKLHEFSLPLPDKSNTIDCPIEQLSVDYRDEEATLIIEFSDHTKKPFDLLPAGYLRIYSIVLDLASRSYLLNKNTNPEGIVLIDEIDLHLHPSLEAEILPRLERSFPRVQLIVSTHSPVAVSSFDQGNCQNADYRLISLQRNDEGYYNQIIGNVYGLDYNSSLETIMGTRQQQKFSDDLIEAYLYWKEKDEAKADKIEQILSQKYDKNNPIIKKLGL